MTTVLGDDVAHSHSHDHDHDYSHDHEQWPEWERARGGPVVLDIGDDVGALIVTIESGRIGSELFIRPTDRPGDETHVAVWERELPNGRTVTAAVFGSLWAGTYAVLDRPSGTELVRVSVTGGVVAEHYLASSSLPTALRAPGEDGHEHEHDGPTISEDHDDARP